MFSTFIATIASFLFLPGLFGFADAAAGDLLSGYGWSPNTGWLSFNCTNYSPPCSGTTHGVTVGSGASTRQLSGYAWSSDIGWITFNASDMINSEPNCGNAGYSPCAPTATLNVAAGLSYGQVSGWARACSVYQTGCSGAIKSDDLLGGWRGWIKLRGSNYGVLANGTKWTGYAWGGAPVTGDVVPGASGSGQCSNGTDGTDSDTLIDLADPGCINAGDFDETNGGSAIAGWISFRGVDTSVTPQVYGVNATGNAAPTRAISCGADKAIISPGGVVQWSAVIDTSKVAGPYSYVWGGNDGPTGTTNPINRTYATALPSPKSAWVTVTAGGIPYFVDCDAVSVSGSPGVWYPSVIVGTYDLNADQPANPVGAQEGVPININGTFDNLGLVIPSSVPFTVRFEFDSNSDGVADQWSTSVVIPGAAVQNNIPFSSSWTPGLQGSTYRIRLCVDTTNVVDEGALEGNNCTSWPGTTFTVGAPPVLPPTGTCTVTPKLTRVGGEVTWDVTPSGGAGAPYTYAWTFTPAPASFVSGSANYTDPTADPVVKYSTVGTKTASVVITSASVSSPSINCSSNVLIRTLTEI